MGAAPAGPLDIVDEVDEGVELYIDDVEGALVTGVEGPNEEELLLMIGRVERGSIGWEMDRNLGEAELELF